MVRPALHWPGHVVYGSLRDASLGGTLWRDATVTHRAGDQAAVDVG
jgi:hypothetical protein